MTTLEQLVDETLAHRMNSDLTPRQTVILRYLADGYTPQQIGGLVNLTQRSISSDIAAAREALAAETTIEAVVTAVLRGLIDGAPKPSRPRWRRQARRPDTGGLTGRELDVLALLAAGLTAAEAGEQLQVPEHAVKDTLRSARSKLGCRNTAHTIAVCIRRGLLPEDTK